MKSELSHKVLLLYLLSRFPEQSESDLMAVALKSLYMDYFSFKTAFDELCEQGFIYLAERKDEARSDASGQRIQRCSLSEAGQNILSTLSEDLPLAVRQTIDREARQEQQHLESVEGIRTKASPDGNGAWTVELELHSGNAELIHLRLNVPNEALAERLKSNWRKDAEYMYPELYRLLLTKSSQT